MSVPFGPIGALCINRIIQHGKWAGLASGLGVALGDSFFAALAVLGISQLTETLLHFQVQLELFAGTLIFISGIRGYLRPAGGEEKGHKGLNALKYATGMFFITIANPQTILGFSIALAGAVRFYHMNDTNDAVLLIMGIFLGSTLWWVMAVTAFDLLRKRLSAGFTERLHKVSAVLVAVIGVILIGHALVSGVLLEAQSHI